MENETTKEYSKTPLNAVSVLGGSIGISLNAVYEMKMKRPCTNQPKAVYYMATVNTTILFERSFVSLSRIKVPTVFSEVATTV